MEQKLKIGYVGLGSQGRGMAMMIERAGWPLYLWARSAKTLEPFRETSAHIVESLVDLGRECDIVAICVINDEDVRKVVIGNGDGILCGMSAGNTLIIHSTIHPDTCRELAQRCAEFGVNLIDAPVSGGGMSDMTKRAIMVGGSKAVFEQCLPLLKIYGNPVSHLGELGSGQTCKLVNNVLFIANINLAKEALRIAKDLQLDVAATTEILKASSGNSFALNVFPFIQGADAWKLLRKDLRLFQSITKSANLMPSSLEAVAEEIIE